MMVTPRSAPTAHAAAFVTDLWAAVPEEEVPLSAISASLDGQVRKQALDEDTVQRYIDDDERGEKLPAVKLRRLPDGVLLIGSGYHRREARQRRGATTLRAKIRPGTIEDAWDDGVEDNLKQGLQFKTEDRQHAAALYLKGERFAHGQISQEWIAKRCGLSPATISRLKVTLSGEIVEPESRTGQDGRTIQTSNIGKGPRRPEGAQGKNGAAPPPQKAPPAPPPQRTPPARTWSFAVPGGGGELVFTQEHVEGDDRLVLTHRDGPPALTRAQWRAVLPQLLAAVADKPSQQKGRRGAGPEMGVLFGEGVTT